MQKKGNLLNNIYCIYRPNYLHNFIDLKAYLYNFIGLKGYLYNLKAYLYNFIDLKPYLYNYRLKGYLYNFIDSKALKLEKLIIKCIKMCCLNSLEQLCVQRTQVQ